MTKDHEYLYPYSAQEAKKRNQLPMWRESYHANVACRNAIEETIRQNFDGMHLKKDCLEPVLAEYAPCTKQQAEELIRRLREIVPYVVIDCSSYIANDILSAVALMEADSVLQLASCDLKSVGYLSSQLPLLGELKWDKDKQYRVASNIKPFQAADRIGQVLGSVVFRLPYSQELEEQYLAGELLADLSMKDSRAFRKEIDRICEEVF